MGVEIERRDSINRLYQTIGTLEANVRNLEVTTVEHKNAMIIHTKKMDDVASTLNQQKGAARAAGIISGFVTGLIGIILNKA